MIGDKGHTMQTFMTLAMQHGGVWVGLGLVASNTKAAQRNDSNYMGGFGGVFAQSPGDASPAEMAQGDLDMGKTLGERVAQLAGKLASVR